MTDYERALLKLECWKALADWGKHPNLEPVVAKTIDERKNTPLLDWPTRMTRAEELFRWTTRVQTMDAKP